MIIQIVDQWRVMADCNRPDKRATDRFKFDTTHTLPLRLSNSVFATFFALSYLH